MRRTVLIAIAGCLATAALVALAGYFYERPTSLKVAVTRDTDDFRLRAIRTYLALSFVPDHVEADHAERWREIDAKLRAAQRR